MDVAVAADTLEELFDAKPFEKFPLLRVSNDGAFSRLVIATELALVRLEEDDDDRELLAAEEEREDESELLLEDDED